MVAIGRLAITALATSANALSLFPAVQNLFESALNTFEGSKKPEIIQVFPNQDERPVPGNSPIIQCDIDTPQILNLQKVIIDPNPPAKGENLTFVATGFLSETIVDGAYVEVDVRYGFIRLIHQTFDLCEEITNVDMQCPVLKGEQIISKEVEIPNEVPAGKYTINARAYTKDDELITCLSATIEFPPS